MGVPLHTRSAPLLMLTFTCRSFVPIGGDVHLGEEEEKEVKTIATRVKAARTWQDIDRVMDRAIQSAGQQLVVREQRQAVPMKMMTGHWQRFETVTELQTRLETAGCHGFSDRRKRFVRQQLGKRGSTRGGTCHLQSRESTSWINTTFRWGPFPWSTPPSVADSRAVPTPDEIKQTARQYGIQGQTVDEIAHNAIQHLAKLKATGEQSQQTMDAIEDLIVDTDISKEATKQDTEPPTAELPTAADAIPSGPDQEKTNAILSREWLLNGPLIQKAIDLSVGVGAERPHVPQLGDAQANKAFSLASLLTANPEKTTFILKHLGENLIAMAASAYQLVSTLFSIWSTKRRLQDLAEIHKTTSHGKVKAYIEAIRLWMAIDFNIATTDDKKSTQRVTEEKKGHVLSPAVRKEIDALLEQLVEQPTEDVKRPSRWKKWSTGWGLPKFGWSFLVWSIVADKTSQLDWNRGWIGIVPVAIHAVVTRLGLGGRHRLLIEVGGAPPL